MSANKKIITNGDVLARMWKEAVMIILNILSQYMLRGTERNNGKLQDSQPLAKF
jgi:hypothetical protein